MRTTGNIIDGSALEPSIGCRTRERARGIPHVRKGCSGSSMTGTPAGALGALEREGFPVMISAVGFGDDGADPAGRVGTAALHGIGRELLAVAHHLRRGAALLSTFLAGACAGRTRGGGPRSGGDVALPARHVTHPKHHGQ